jgi:hypothetical protein
MSESDVDVESGLGGRLETRELPFGGRGKEPILVVLRTVLPGVGMPDEGVEPPGDTTPECAAPTVLSVGTAGVDRDLGVGSPEAVTDRVSDLGVVAGREGSGSLASGMSGSGFLVFATGSAGSGPDGGASGEVLGRRMPVDVMVVVVDVDMIYVLHPPVYDVS